MAKLKFPLLSKTASGNVGGKIQYRTKGDTTHAHRPPDPKAINQGKASAAQQAVRDAYATARAAWWALDDDGRQTYREQAHATGSSMTGWNLFVKLNIHQASNMNLLKFSNGIPAPTLGEDGDFAFDYKGHGFYGPKEAGSWGDAASFVTAADLDDAISELNLGSASTYDAGDFATKEQGEKADNALQPGSVTAQSLGLGSSAAHDTGFFATAAQGEKADSALQGGSQFATAAQGEKADSALQPGSISASSLGLGNVENTALSSWGGSGNIATVGSTVHLGTNGPRLRVDGANLYTESGEGLNSINVNAYKFNGLILGLSGDTGFNVSSGVYGLVLSNKRIHASYNDEFIEITGNNGAVLNILNGGSLGGAGLLNIGNTAGTVCAGDDPRLNGGGNFDKFFGAVGAWLLDETSGSSVSDSSGFFNTGTATNTSIVDGIINGKARQFNGTSSYVLCGALKPYLQFANQSVGISISALFKASSLPSNGSTYFIVGDYSGATSNCFSYYIGITNSGGLVKFIFYMERKNEIGVSVLSDILVYTDTAYHIVGVSNGQYMFLYINGVLHCTPVAINIGLCSASKGTISIGRMTDTALLFANGIIDECIIYNRALTETEVASLHGIYKT